MANDATQDAGGLSRRLLLGSTMGAPLAASLAGQAEAAPPPDQAAAPLVVSLTVNGAAQQFTVDPRTTLLDALRLRLGLTGTKKGCDHGQCGACTVMIGGTPHLSCLTLAVMVRDPVVTIEGLAPSETELHPMQQAFIDQDAFQCGYCTPGQIIAAIGCVQSGHAENPADLRDYMSGNLCRCAAYPHIVAAIEQAKPALQKG